MCVCVCVCVCVSVCTRACLHNRHIDIDRIMSDSLQNRALKPTRLLCPRDFPGKNTGAVCHFHLQEIFLDQTLISCISKKILYHWGQLETTPPNGITRSVSLAPHPPLCFENCLSVKGLSRPGLLCSWFLPPDMDLRQEASTGADLRTLIP